MRACVCVCVCKYEDMAWFYLIWFYGISAIVGHLK